MNVQQEFKKICPRFGYLIYHKDNKNAKMSEDYIYVPNNIKPNIPMDFGETKYCIVGEFHNYDRKYGECDTCFEYSMIFAEEEVKKIIPEFINHCKKEHIELCIIKKLETIS